MRLDSPDGWRKYLRPQISQARQDITQRIAEVAASLRKGDISVSVGMHRVIREAIRDFAEPLVQAAIERLAHVRHHGVPLADVEAALTAGIHAEVDLLPRWIGSMPDSRIVWGTPRERDTKDLCNFAKSRASDLIASAIQDFRDVSVSEPAAQAPAQVAAASTRDSAPNKDEPGGNTSNQPQLAPSRFSGGEIVFFSDRVEICGVVICSGPRSKTARKALELLSQKNRQGTFVAYAGTMLANKVGLKAGQNGAAGLIRDLRRGIAEALRKAALECGQDDVIISGGPGYRLNECLTVQREDQRRGRSTNDTDDTNDPDPDDTDDRDTNDTDDTDQQAKTRRAWILDELGRGREVRAPHVAAQFQCSLPTAKRDLARLKAEKRIEFVGSSRMGRYRVRRKR